MTVKCSHFYIAQKDFFHYFCISKRGNSSVDRALAFQAGGRGFEPRFPLKEKGDWFQSPFFYFITQCTIENDQFRLYATDVSDRSIDEAAVRFAAGNISIHHKETSFVFSEISFHSIAKLFSQYCKVLFNTVKIQFAPKKK